MSSPADRKRACKLTLEERRAANREAQRRYRARQGDKELVVPVLMCKRSRIYLARLGWVDKAELNNRTQVGLAIAALLKEAEKNS
jgi:hypothetical protein